MYIPIDCMLVAAFSLPQVHNSKQIPIMRANFFLIDKHLKSVVVPTRRGLAEAFQILISHLLGDAGSPYLIRVVSLKFILIIFCENVSLINILIQPKPRKGKASKKSATPIRSDVWHLASPWFKPTTL